MIHLVLLPLLLLLESGAIMRFIQQNICVCVLFFTTLYLHCI